MGWMHATVYTKKLSQFDSFQYLFEFHASWWKFGKSFSLNFVIDDSWCPNIALCCEINALMNE
jgi:hypothetical protein